MMCSTTGDNTYADCSIHRQIRPDRSDAGKITKN